MKSFKFIEHSADIAAELRADTIEELFSTGLEAWRSSAVEKLKFEGNEIRDLRLSAINLEILLVDFLNEINFWLMSYRWLYDSVKILIITEKNGGYELFTQMTGKKFDHHKIQLKNEIKAVTYHQMEIKKIRLKYKTKIIFDI